jgi:hypothetical protein
LVSAAHRAALQTVFSVVESPDKLTADPAANQKLRDAIAVKRGQIGSIPFPRRITHDHFQRALTHKDSVVAELKSYLLNVDDEVQSALAEVAISEVFTRPADLFGSAGLIFAGFGDHDIFPHLIEYQSSGMLEGTQVIQETRRSAIDHSLPASLHAFAQTSMTDTFHVGFSGDVYSALMRVLSERLKGFADKICATIGGKF